MKNKWLTNETYESIKNHKDFTEHSPIKHKDIFYLISSMGVFDDNENHFEVLVNKSGSVWFGCDYSHGKVDYDYDVFNVEQTIKFDSLIEFLTWYELTKKCFDWS